MSQNASQSGQSNEPVDPLMDEVRWLKQEAAARANHDLRTLVEHAREVERAHPGRVVDPPSNKNTSENRAA